jgi:hypothetical protein
VGVDLIAHNPNDPYDTAPSACTIMQIVTNRTLYRYQPSWSKPELKVLYELESSAVEVALV